MKIEEALDDLLLDGLPDLVRVDDLAARVPRCPRSRIARWLRSVGAQEQPRYTKGGRRAHRLWSLRRHDDWRAAGAAARLRAYLGGRA
jgi:hypothetical protein